MRGARPPARRPLQARDRRLLSNTVLLYIMTFSAQLFNLATVPYLTRTLGPGVYGKVGIALSYMAYVQILIDFGFILSATRRVAEHKEDRRYLSQILTAVTAIKGALSLCVSALFMGYVLLSDGLRADAGFFGLYLAAQALYALLPDFLYRGLEEMRVITWRTVAVKTAFMVLVFAFVKGPGDYMRLPLITLAGNGVAVVSMYLHTVRKRGITFCRVGLPVLRGHLRDSLQFFASRVSGTVYQASNAIVLSFVYGTASSVIGYYASADKIVSLVKSLSSPVADSLYPYMVKHKNYRLIRRLLCLVMPCIVAAVVVCAIFPHQICAALFGAEYAPAGDILRLLLPYVLVIFPTYILAFPTMVPMGLTKYANLSNVIGFGMQVAMVGAFAIFGRLNVYTLCIATSITEVGVFLMRLVCVLQRRARIRRGL